MPSEKSLRLASFDGGGPRAFSQLVIMKRFMYQLGGRGNQGKTLLPCDWFDMIGGSDTGGLIAIMFVKLHMSVDEVMQEFSKIVGQVYAKGLEPTERTQRMRTCIESLLIQKGFPVDLRLEEQTQARRCAGFVVSAFKLNVLDKVCFRTYFVPTDPPSGVTVVEAILATCASPTEFLPVEIGIEPEKKEYVGATIGTNNPIRHLITEAHTHFEQESKVGLILSTGSGHPSIFASDHNKKKNSLRTLLFEMMHDAALEASKIRTMTYSRVYFRFSVSQGLRNAQAHAERFKWISTQTNAYIRFGGAAKRLKKCVKQAQNGSIKISLKRLNHAWGLSPDTPSNGTSCRSASGDGLPFSDSPTQKVPDYSPEAIGIRPLEEPDCNFGLGENVPSPSSTSYYSTLGDDKLLLDSTYCSPVLEYDLQYVDSPTEGASRNIPGSIHIEVNQDTKSQPVLDRQTKHPNRTYSETIKEPVPAVPKDREMHFERLQPQGISVIAPNAQFPSQSRQKRRTLRNLSIPAMRQQNKGALKLRRFSTLPSSHMIRKVSGFHSSHPQAAGTRARVEEATKAKALEDAGPAEQQLLADEAESTRLEDERIVVNGFAVEEARVAEEHIAAAARAAERQSTQADPKQAKERDRLLQQILLRALQYVPMPRRHARLQTATVAGLLRSALPAALLSQISLDIPQARDNHSTVATGSAWGS